MLGLSMRSVLRHILLCLSLTFCLGVKAFAIPQGDNYDKALDKYAYICDRCVEMRAKVESGQSIQMESLGSLLAELSSLKKTLSNASGKMSAAQAERFEAIKAKYMQGMKALGKKSDRPVFSPVQRINPVTEPVEVTLIEMPERSLRLAQRPAPQVQRPEPQAQHPERQSRHQEMQVKQSERQTQHPKGKTPRPKEGLKLTLLADAGIFPIPSYGAMAVMTLRGVGAYANYRSDFRKNEYSYTCTSEGDTEYGRIWATGESRVSHTVATAGLAVWTSRRFGFYAGAGLSSSTRCWEDISGEWAKVEDKSYRGVAADGGILLTFKPMALSVGVVSDFRRYVDVQIGVGVRF